MYLKFQTEACVGGCEEFIVEVAQYRLRRDVYKHDEKVVTLQFLREGIPVKAYVTTPGYGEKMEEESIDAMSEGRPLPSEPEVGIFHIAYVQNNEGETIEVIRP